MDNEKKQNFFMLFIMIALVFLACMTIGITAGFLPFLDAVSFMAGGVIVVVLAAVMFGINKKKTKDDKRNDNT